MRSRLKLVQPNLPFPSAGDLKVQSVQALIKDFPPPLTLENRNHTHELWDYSFLAHNNRAFASFINKHACVGARIMKERHSVKHKILTILLAVVAFAMSAKAQGTVQAIDSLETQHETHSRFAVQKTSPTNEKDLERKVADLRNPENLTTETTYDEKTHMYIVGNKIGDSYLSVPLLMTPEEYAEWSMKRSLDAFFRNKNQEA